MNLFHLEMGLEKYSLQGQIFGGSTPDTNNKTRYMVKHLPEF